MTRLPFGRTGLEASVLGFGGAPIGFLAVDQQRTAGILNFLLDSGVNLIDTAAMYEGSEELIGKAIGHRRDEYILVSKCGTHIPGIDAPVFSAESVRQTIDRSLRRLGTDRLDVMLLHSCDLSTLRKGEAIDALLAAQKAGKIRFAGYSGDNEAAAWAAAHASLHVIETSISIADQANIDLVLPICRLHNVAVLAKRPIANAAWKDLEQQPGMYKKYAAVYTERLRQMSLAPTDLGFSPSAEQAWPEIALRFTLAQEGVNTAIIGTTNPDNARANIAFAGKGPLPPEAVARIRAAFAKAAANSSTKWDGQT